MKTKQHAGRFLRQAVAAGSLALAAILPAQADYSNTVMSLNPVGYWRLNDTTPLPQDSAINLGGLGTVGNGLYSGGATHGVGVPGALAGSSGTAADFTPAAAKVQTPWNAAINPAGPFTVECWANSTAAAGGNHTLVQSMVQGQNAANGNDRSGWCLREVGNDLQFVVGTTTGAPFYYYYTAVGVVIAGVWQHIVAVYDGTTPHLFIDGVEASLTITRQDGLTPAPGELAAVRVLPNLLAPTIIAQRGYDNGWHFEGQIDEIAIYGTALSGADILTHYQNGTNASRLTPYQSVVLANQPVVYYRLDEPAFTFVPPPAVNNGTWLAGGNGAYYPGSAPLASGVPYKGFGTNNTGCQFAGIGGLKDGDVGNPLTPGSCIKVPAQSGIVDEMTIACWVKRNGDHLYWRGLVTQRDSDSSAPNGAGNGTGLTLGADGTSPDQGAELRMLWNKGDVYWQWSPQLNTPNQQWAFCAVVFSTTNRTIYLNTRQASQTVEAAGANMPQTPHDWAVNPIFIGYDARGPYYNENSAFNGTMDEVAIFNRALTSNEIMQIYAAAEVPPIILVQPQAPPPPVYEGMMLSLSVVADAGASVSPLAYQWTRNGIPISGQTATNFAISTLATTDTANYAVVVTNTFGAVTSSVVALTVQVGPPVIVSAPQSATRYLGGVANFSATVVGSVPMTFQWLHGTTVIPGATTATLTLSELQPADAGTYTFRAINEYGTNESITTLTLVTATKVAAAVIDKEPLGYWQMNEASGTVADDSWGLLNGTLSASGVTNNVVGPLPPSFQGFETANKAYALNGAGGYVTLPSFGQFNGAMTIIAWIKPNAAQSDFAGLVFTRGGSGGGTSGLDFTQGNQLGYHWNDAAASYNWRSALVPVADQWNFVALVVEPTQATIYLDASDGAGLQSAVNTMNHGTATWSGVRFGSDPGGARDYKGSMDDVAVYNYSFTADEIAAIRNAGVANTYTPTGLSFVSQPQSQTVIAGNTANFSASVEGSQPISYQWQKNGVNIPGAIRKTLSIPGVYYTDAGAYSLRATNSVGGAGSASATLTVMPTPEYALVTNNLVLHLKFEGNYQDSSGRNNHGTPMGTPSIVAGRLGQALRYNTDPDLGQYNYVTLGTPADLQFTNGVSFSVAFWIKFTGAPGDLPFLCNNSFSYGGQGVTLAPSYNQGAWSWYLNDALAADWAGIGVYAPQQNTLNNGAWHHLVYTFDRTGNAAVYRNGVMEDQRSIAAGADWSLDTGMQLLIGQAGGVYAEKAAFDMDDMGIWRRALNSYEALSIYNAALNGLSFDTGGPIKIGVNQVGSNIDVSWQGGTLKQSNTINGTYTPVPGATAPFYRTTATGSAMFFKVQP